MIHWASANLVLVLLNHWILNVSEVDEDRGAVVAVVAVVAAVAVVAGIVVVVAVVAVVAFVAVFRLKSTEVQMNEGAPYFTCKSNGMFPFT